MTRQITRSLEKTDKNMTNNHEIPIIFDHKQYKVPPGTITGAQLRTLPQPPIGADYDIWQDVPGGDDIKIADGQAVAIKPGMHFYSAPSTINPGAA
jgi:hypothetical protein